MQEENLKGADTQKLSKNDFVEARMVSWITCGWDQG